VSCRVVSCRVVSCRVVSCRVVSCRVVSCRVVSCRVVRVSRAQRAIDTLLNQLDPNHTGRIFLPDFVANALLSGAIKNQVPHPSEQKQSHLVDVLAEHTTTVKRISKPPGGGYDSAARSLEAGLTHVQPKKRATTVDGNTARFDVGSSPEIAAETEDDGVTVAPSPDNSDVADDTGVEDSVFAGVADDDNDDDDEVSACPFPHMRHIVAHSRTHAAQLPITPLAPLTHTLPPPRTQSPTHSLCLADSSRCVLIHILSHS
jgi:hypothetical protein